MVGWAHPALGGLTGDERFGTIVTRQYKGRLLQVTVLDKGFEHEGEVYRSLSAVANAVTGSHVNGFAFFNLGGEKSGS